MHVNVVISLLRDQQATRNDGNMESEIKGFADVTSVSKQGSGRVQKKTRICLNALCMFSSALSFKNWEDYTNMYAIEYD